jgi:ATP-dependent Clp protease ATP-binding subunit ClpA
VYERFTDQARTVMQTANEEARRRGHEYIGTEHILLALAKDGSGVAANALKNLEIETRKLRVEVEKMIPSGPSKATTGKLPQTPPAKKAIEYSIEEARSLKHNFVGTEHLLLGLLREQEGVAAQILMNLGLKLEEVRAEIVRLLGHSSNVQKGPDQPVPGRGGQDLNTAFPYLPEAVIQSLKEINDRFQHLAVEKESAIAKHDFEKAASLRDREVKMKRQLLDTVKNLATPLLETDEDSK